MKFLFRKRPEPRILADRYDQKAELARFLKERAFGAARCLLIEAEEASGISHFLMAMAEAEDAHSDCVYADMERDSQKDLIERFLARRAHGLGGRLHAMLHLPTIWGGFFKILAALPFQSPWARPALIGAGEAGGFFFSPYGSEPIEKFARAASSRLMPRPSVVFIDNAQKEEQRVQELLRVTYARNYEGTTFVLAHVRRSGASSFSEFKARLKSKSGHKIQTLAFPAPDDTLLSALDPQLEQNERAQFLTASGRNIHRLKGIIEGAPVAKAQLGALEQFLLKALVSAEQSLKLSDLRIICVTSSLVATPSQAEMSQGLAQLVAFNLIHCFPAEDGDTLVALVGRAHPVVQEVSGAASLLAVKADLYRYFAEAAQGSVRHSASALAGLLYRLAREVAPEHLAQRAQHVFDISLKMGNLDEARRYLDDAIEIGDDLRASFMRAAFHVARLEFQPVLDILAKIGRPTWSKYRILTIFHAIALNRVRDHQASNMEIDRLLAEDRSPEEVALLSSYKISALLHDEQFEEARRLRDQVDGRASQARCYGYFLRSTAAAYMWDAPPHKPNLALARTLLKQAISIFDGEGDRFGALTALTNLAVATAYGGDNESAWQMTEQAYAGLAAFGLHNVEEVAVNLGTARVLTGRVEEAAQHLSGILPALSDDFPKALGEATLVVAELCLGNLRNAEQIAMRLREWAPSVGLDEAVRRADQAVRLVRKTATENLDAAGILKECSVEWCQYWSQNPLTMLPASYLAF